MKKAIILAAISLSGCMGSGGTPPDVGVAPAVKMPELTPHLSQRAVHLPDIVDRSAGGQQKDATATDIHYNELAFRYNALVDAWECVRKALIERNGTAAELCLKSSETDAGH